MADTFRSIGYPASKVRYLVNRADSPGGIDPDDLQRALGRVPEHRVMSDGQLVVRSNNEGVPFILANPTARSARTSSASPPSCSAPPASRSPPGAARSAVTDPRPIGVFDSGVGGLTVLREIIRRSPARVDALPRRQRPRAVRHPHRRRGPRLLDPVARRARRARRQGARRRLQHVDRGRAGGVPAPLRPARARRDPAGAAAAALATRNRRVGVIATPATIRSHAYFNAIKDENPAVEVYEHATPALVPMVEAGELSGDGRRGDRRRGPRAAARRARRRRRVDLPAAAGRHDRHAAPRLHPLPAARPVIAALVGDESRSSIPRPRRRRRSPSC